VRHFSVMPCAQVTAAMKHMEQNPSKELPVVVVTITKETMMALRTDMCAEPCIVALLYAQHDDESRDGVRCCLPQILAVRHMLKLDSPDASRRQCHTRSEPHRWGAVPTYSWRLTSASGSDPRRTWRASRTSSWAR